MSGVPWSGSETSRARAVARSADGTERKLREQILEYLELRRAAGATWQEVANRFGVHHGTASGALSSLHKEGAIMRLSSQREKRSVYVLPHWREGRPFLSHGGSPRLAKCPECGHAFTLEKE